MLRKNFPGSRAKRQAEAMARGWTFSKRDAADRPRLIETITENTMRNMG